MPRPRRPKQLALARTSGWGGKRKNAGCKPKGLRAGVTHAARPALAARFPSHVTLRVLPHVYNLRSQRSFREIRAALQKGRERFGMRICELSVQGNHLHLLVEAADATALSRGMQGFCVRVARGLNRMMGRTGRVWADRYHARILRTPTEVRRAFAYVRGNRDVHLRRQGQKTGVSADPYSSAGERLALAAPRTWLLGQARREAGGRAPPGTCPAGHDG